MDTERIGITIITGFLGAGKTSLLNQVIKKEHEHKFAIIENEFGELGIDTEIISGIEGSSIFELSNGCICCTMNTELQETMVQLLNSSFEFSHLLIETTGIAEPDSIIQSVIANNELRDKFYIDGVICLVDAVNFHANCEKPESIKQIAMADVVLINKIENSTVDSINEIKSFLLQLNPLSIIIATVHSDYKQEQLIKSRLFNKEVFENAFKRPEFDFQKHLSLDVPIRSISIVIDGSFDEEKFMFWMEYFLLLNQSSIYRAKGILSFEGNSRKQIFQAVKAAFSIEEGSFWESGENRHNRIIFIGKEPDRTEITKGLLSLMPD